MKIVIDDKIPFIRGAFEPFADVCYIDGASIDRKAVSDADALVVRTRTRCDKSLLEGSSVRAIASATIGYDHIDTRWCEENGILWSNAPGCNSASVARYILSVICFEILKRGWKFSDKTLGVVGVGHVGSKVVERAKALGMKILMCDPPRAAREGEDGFVTLDDILSSADIITLHVPLDKPTFHLLDFQKLSGLGKHQILINSSRGPVVDNAALKSVLQKGSLGGAVLDVWEGEPHIDSELADLCDLSTPHIAGYSADGKMTGTQMSVRFIASCLNLPLNRWEPAPLPSPESLIIDAAGLDFEQVVAKAMAFTYDVEADSSLLKKDLSRFESIRGHYPVRREMPYYKLCVENADRRLAEALASLGFGIV